MKKMFFCLAILTMLISMVSCGSTENGGTSESKATTKVAVTTIADSAKDEKTATTAANGAEKSKDSAKSETTANDAANSNLDLKEEERLFGGYVDTQGDVLNLRNEPFPTADIIGTIPDKTQIDVYSCGKADWYCTSYNGKSGYVSADYIKEIESYMGNASAGINVAPAPTVAEAVEIRDALNFADELMTSCGLNTDTTQEYVSENGNIYHKVVDGSFRSTADIRNYFTTYMTESYISSRYDNLYGSSNSKCIDVNGELYLEYRPIGGIYSFYNDTPVIVASENYEEGYSIKLRANCYGSDIIVVVDVIREDERWKIIDVQ